MKHKSVSSRTAGVFACTMRRYLVSRRWPPVRALARDVVAYLVNVHVRPGYNFPNADAALSYGYGICDKVAAGRGFPEVMADVRADFNTSDDYQASYLIIAGCQRTLPRSDLAAANSAAHYQSPPGVTP